MLRVSGGGAVVQCSTCDQDIDEPPGLPLEQQKPCPNCGSRGRFVELAASLGATKVIPVGTALEGNQAMSIIPIKTVRPETRDRLREALAAYEHARIFALQPLADGAFQAAVLDEDGNVVASGIGDNEDDAVLELAEYLQRPK